MRKSSRSSGGSSLGPFLSELRRFLPQDAVLTDAQARSDHAMDALRGFRGLPSYARTIRPPLAVVQPNSTRDIQRVARLCGRHRIPMVPFGGGSGLMGGAASIRQGIVLDLKRMNRVLEMDKDSLMATIEPGITWSTLNSRLSIHGLESGHDPWTVAVATVGGAISTDGYGYLAGRYGSAGDQVLGLEVVLADGSKLEIRPARKRSTGPDLRRLFIGAEGTLGVISRCTLTIHPIPEARAPRLYTFDDFETGYRAVLALFTAGLHPTSLDFGMENWPEATTVPRPSAGTDLAKRPYLLLVFDGPVDIVKLHHARAVNILQAFKAEPRPEAEAQAQWGQRHAIAELWASSPEARNGEWLRDVIASQAQTSSGRRGNLPQFDYLHTCLPPSRLLDFRKSACSVLVSQSCALLQEGVWIRPDFYSILMLTSGPRAAQRMQRCRDALIHLAHKMGGSMEYVHGVGFHLRKHVPAEWGSAYPLLKQIKKQLDPNNLLNPGKLLQESLTKRGSET